MQSNYNWLACDLYLKRDSSKSNTEIPMINWLFESSIWMHHSNENRIVIIFFMII